MQLITLSKYASSFFITKCKDAEDKGLLKPGGVVVEGTAGSSSKIQHIQILGNTGIGMAHVCQAKGYKLVIYMPDTQSQGMTIIKFN